MAQVAMPLVPPGPVRAFYERLHALHVAAGQPSMRQIQRGTRGESRPSGINPTTIHDVFSAPRLSRWDVVRAVVHQLGGDIAEFAELWRAARAAEAAAQLPSPATAEEVPRADVAVPRQLPPDVYGFTGRAESLAMLDRLLIPSSEQPTAMVISALAGTAGVGKTALAVHWAHRVADRFPDGHLYVDLRGYGPDQPVPAENALARFLRSLGVPSADIPYDPAECAARYRSLMAGRRMLVVLDNAGSAAQVRPLLPGARTCLVLVTSRDSLAGLVARDGARRIDLELLDADEANSLLRTQIGARADAEPRAAQALAMLCTRLPLALRIAAELAVGRPAATLAELVEELGDENTRLYLLDAGADTYTGIRSVFSWSYHGLPSAAARLFPLLGLNIVPDIDGYTAAALVGCAPGEIRGALDMIARAHLIRHVAAGRYAMHDLLRMYAAELAEREHDEPSRRAAVGRVLDLYLIAASRAMDTVFPAERHRRPRQAAGTVAAPMFASPGVARAWLDDRRGSFVTVIEYAAEHGWPEYAIAMSAVLWRYLQNGAHHSEAVAVHSAALQAARRIGDRWGEGTALVNLGTVSWRLGWYTDAAARYEQAIAALREVGDRVGEARVLANLGAVNWLWGQYETAADSCQQALMAFTEAADLAGEALTLGNLGSIRARQGRHDEAADCHERAVKTLREINDHVGEARGLDNLGAVRMQQGRHDDAAECFRQALEVLRSAGDRTGEAGVLENLGNLHRIHGRYVDACAHFTEALEIASGIGNSNREVSTVNSLGETLQALGRSREARERHEAALTKSRECGNRYEEARALTGIAEALRTAGDSESARRHWRAALAVYTEIDVPEADDVRLRLREAQVRQCSAR